MEMLWSSGARCCAPEYWFGGEPPEEKEKDSNRQ